MNSTKTYLFDYLFRVKKYCFCIQCYDTPLGAADSAQIRALLYFHLCLQALARNYGLAEECLCCWFCRCDYRDWNVSYF